MDRLSKIVKSFADTVSLTWFSSLSSETGVSPFNVQGKVFCTWHEHLLPILVILQGSNLAILASRSKDGRRIGNIAETWGFKTIYGSSTKGGTKALRESLRLLRLGNNIGYTPDGPRGPRRELKNGVITLSRLSKTEIYPVSADGFPIIRLLSWDRFMVPFPLAKVSIKIASPVLPFDPDGRPREDSDIREELVDKLSSL